MIFVTGGTGLVGAHILLQLADRGEKVRALKRSTSNTKKVEAFFKRHKSQEIFHKIEWIEGDLLDITFLPQALEGVTTIIHTAAFVSFDEKDEHQIIQVNVDGTEGLVNEAIDSGVENFIFISSIAAMDDLNPVTKLIDEKSTWNNEISHSTYAISKYRSEMEVWRGSQEGLNVLVLNPSVIIGTFDGNRESEKLFAPNYLQQFSPSGGTGFVDVRDVVNILFKLYDQKIYHQKYILSAANKRYQEVLEYVAQKQHKSITTLSNPTLKAVQVASTIGRLFGLPALSQGTYKALTTYTKYDHAKICTTLNYQFISVEDSIDYHYAHYQKIISSQ